MIPNDAVVHLTMMRGDQSLAVGTGVLYRHDARTYIVTAWHNLTGRHSETMAARGGIPDRVVAYLACQLDTPNGAGGIRLPFTIPLEDEEKTFYLVHPQGWPRVDVAVIPLDLEHRFDLNFQLSDGSKQTITLPLHDPAGADGPSRKLVCIQDFGGGHERFGVDFENALSVSDDLFILGYPRGLIDRTGQPLWKRATVATVPELGWNSQQTFLVDCASREGMSGAPAISYSKTGKLQVGGMRYHTDGAVTLLHGIYVNRLGKTDQFEAQIGTVWRREVIDVIIQRGMYGRHSSEIEATQVEVRDAIAANWPVEAHAYARGIIHEGRPSEWFTQTIMKKIEGRADFSYVDGLVRDAAEQLLREAIDNNGSP